MGSPIGTEAPMATRHHRQLNDTLPRGVPAARQCAEHIDKHRMPESIRGMQTTHFTNAQGLRLSAYNWWPDQPRAIVLGLHGYSSHAQFEFLLAASPGMPHTQYERSLPQQLMAANIAFCCYDQQGHGHSECARNTFTYFDRFEGERQCFWWRPMSAFLF